MHERREDIAELQRVLDRSYAAAGPQLLRIHTPERRLRAEELAARLQGMCLLVLATVNSRGRPIGGPVDGIFYRGAFHFGTSPDALRVRHLRQRPWVTATHLPGEAFAVTVHGRAVPVDLRAADGAGLRQTLLEVYVPRYGPEWEAFLDSGPVYARIEAERVFGFSIPPSDPAAAAGAAADDPASTSNRSAARSALGEATT